MDERTFRQRELWVKCVTAAVVIFGTAIGLWKYLDSVEKDFRKPYWERQVSLYFEATSAAAILASSQNEKDLAEAEALFWRLYWGPLALVEDRRVEKAMFRFGKCLNQGCPKRDLQDLSLALAYACRHSLGASWDINLESLKGRVQ